MEDKRRKEEGGYTCLLQVQILQNQIGSQFIQQPVAGA